MIDSEARFETLVNKLKERDHRITPQRVALLRILAASEEHPSAAQLFDQLKDTYATMSPGTVYKTLDLLKEMGEVLEFGFSDDDNRYDGGKPYPHPHLVCRRCHKIIDAEPIDLPSPAMMAEMARHSGFRIEGYRLEFYGLCPDCQAGEN